MRAALLLAGALAFLLCQGSEAAGGGVTAIGKYNYTQVLSYSLLFYHAQRTGKLPATNPIPWRGDSCLNDVGLSGEDLTGGWFDAGDFMKYNFPMSASTTVLAWSIVEDWNMYQAAGLLPDMLDCVKWVTDYLVKCHVSPNVFYGQLDTTQTSHNQWMRPESISWTRTPYKIDSAHPGSDMAAEAAAALAATSLAFRGTNASYSDILLRHSHQLFQFANTSRGKYTDSITDAASVYPSSNYKDELVWASVWLARASNVTNSVSAGFPTPAAYLSFAEWGFSAYSLAGSSEFSWDDKGIGAAVLLARLTNKNTYHSAVQSFVNGWLPGSGRTYTPKGLAWYSQWGSLRYAALASWIAASYAEFINPTQPVLATRYLNFSVNQGHYILGDSGRSFVVGFGVNPPDRPHHAAASCPNPPATCDWNTYNTNTPNPHILYGAMVGGPDQNDAFTNLRTDYVENEVACDYNSGMHALMGKILKLQLQLAPASIPTNGGNSTGGGTGGSGSTGGMTGSGSNTGGTTGSGSSTGGTTGGNSTGSGTGSGDGGPGGQSSAATSDLRAGIVSFLISCFVITFSIFVTMHH